MPDIKLTWEGDSGNYPLGGGLDIQLDLEDGATFPAGSSVAASGQVTATPGAANVVFVVDMSGSIISVTGLDANYDGVVDEADNLNGDQRTGDILDAQIGAILNIIPTLSAATNDLQVAVVVFGSTAEPLDQGPEPLNQELRDPEIDNDANGVPDVEDALRSTDVYDTIFVITPGVRLFKSFTFGSGTHFDNALVTVDQLLDRAADADATEIVFFSDGEPVKVQLIEGLQSDTRLKKLPHEDGVLTTWMLPGTYRFWTEDREGTLVVDEGDCVRARVHLHPKPTEEER